MTRLYSLILVLLGSVAAVKAQNIGFYSDLQFNASTGDVSSYAETWTDYSSQYYYDVNTYSQINVSQNGGPFQITCQAYGYGYNSNAESRCSENVGTGTIDLELISTHTVTASYNVYQFDTYCSYDCSYYWDAFRTSLMGASGQVWVDSNPSYFAPGPPAIRSPQEQTAYGYISKKKSNRPCTYPTGESSWATGGWSTIYPYLAAYNADLAAGLNNFNNRVVGEILDEVQRDTCWYRESPYSQMYMGEMGYWTVGTQRVENGTPVSYITNTYGVDFIGFTNTAAYYHYRSRMQSLGEQCGMMYRQRMRMECGGESQEYGSAHGLSIYVNSYGLDTQRDQAKAKKY